MKHDDPVLFIPLGTFAFEQQLATALYFASQSDLKLHFLLISKHDYHLGQRLDAAGIPHTRLDSSKKNRDESDFAKPRRDSWIRIFGFSEFVKLREWCYQLRSREKDTRKLAESLGPCCAVVSQERLIDFLPVLKALRNLRIPIILVPAGFDAWPGAPASIRESNSLLKEGLGNKSGPPASILFSVVVGTLNRLVQRLLPSQVYTSKWGAMIFYPAIHVFLLKLFGMLPRNPWYQGSTFADYIMISGTDEAAIYAEGGINPEKLLLFGSQPLDTLFELRSDRDELRCRLVDKYGLDGSRRIAIVSLPRLWEQNLISEDGHWRSIKQILSTLSGQDCNVMISLHPSSDDNLYRWIERDYPIAFLEEPLADILVASDLFVASYSSTIRWAVGLGIPVINLDIWGLDWDMYKKQLGCQTVTTISELDDTVRRIVKRSNNESADGSMTETNVLVDGKAKDRLLDFIATLNPISRKPARHN